MTKWIVRILVTLVALAILAVVGIKWFLVQAFGPRERTVEIDLSDTQTLICKETYNADMHAVFYGVDFTLRDNHQSFELGSATFMKDNWQNGIKLYSLDEWYVLPVEDQAFVKILLRHKKNEIRKDTILRPRHLRRDNTWKIKNDRLPSDIYTGRSELSSVDSEGITVAFEYRLGDFEPFVHIRQKVKYELDDSTGNLVTREVFDPELAK